MKNVQKLMMIAGFISVAGGTQAARLLGTEGQGSTADKVAQLQLHINKNSARLAELKLDDTCKNWIPNSVDCALQSAEKAGLIAQNASLEGTIAVLELRKGLEGVGKAWHNDVAKNIVADEDIVYDDQYDNNRYQHRFGRDRRADRRAYYNDGYYDNGYRSGLVANTVEGTAQGAADVVEGAGEVTADVVGGVEAGIGSLFGR